MNIKESKIALYLALLKLPPEKLTYDEYEIMWLLANSPEVQSVLNATRTIIKQSDL